MARVPQLIFMMTVLNLICNFYIQSQADQAAAMFGADEAALLGSIFNVAFPVVRAPHTHQPCVANRKHRTARSTHPGSAKPVQRSC